MAEEDGLHKLAREWRGELRGKNLAGRVLADFWLIQGLRLQKCPWHRIAGAMGVNPDSLRKLFLWTATEIKAKRLEPPVTTPAPTSVTARRPATAGSQQEATPPATPPMPGQKPTPTDEMSEMDKLRAEFK